MGYNQSGSGGGLANIVEDLSPQLGGNLDVNNKSIVSTTAGNIVVAPDTTGSIILDGLSWPQADGTVGQVMTTNGLGGLSWSTVSGGGGEVSVDSGTMTIAPSAGGIVDCVAIGNGAVVAAGSIEAIAVGKSRVGGAVALSAMINNNTATYGAQNTGAVAIGLLNKSTGIYSTIIGGNINIATGSYSIVAGGKGNTASGLNAANLGGNNNTASGLNAANLGGSFNVASGSYAVTSGNGAVADKYGQNAQNSGVFNTAGDCQKSELIARIQTTNATAAELFLDGSAARASLPSSTTWGFLGSVTARQTGGTAGTSGDSAGWKIEGVIKRDAANNTLLVGTPTVTSIGADAAAAAWAVAITADDVNKSLKISFTGEANKNINITAVIEPAECGG